MSGATDITLVTGGTKGIGRAIVEALVGAGKQVAFTWRSDKALARKVEEESGGAATGLAFDLRDRSRASLVVDEVEQKLGPIAGLVNNAGIQASTLLALTTDETWDEILDINLGGAFRMTREVLRHMVSRRRGAIVNVSSLSALHGVPGHAAYAASKAGLIGFSRSVAREVAARNITVNVVAPGLIDTDMTRALPPEVQAEWQSKVPLSRFGTPEDVAAAVCFLASDEASYITGQVLAVNGGMYT